MIVPIETLSVITTLLTTLISNNLVSSIRILVLNVMSESPVVLFPQFPFDILALAI